MTILLTHPTALFIVGDFNHPDIDWTTLTSILTNLEDFVFQHNLTQHNDTSLTISLAGLRAFLLYVDFSSCLASNNIEYVWCAIKEAIYKGMNLFIPKVLIRSQCFNILGPMLSAPICIQIDKTILSVWMQVYKSMGADKKFSFLWW